MNTSSPAGTAGPPRPSLWKRLVSLLSAGALLLIAALLAQLASGFVGCSVASPGEYRFLAAGAAALGVWALVRPRFALIIGAVGLIGFPVALPRLLTPVGPCNEEATLADLKAVMAAQERYSAANEGLFDGNLPCLSRPDTCLPERSEPREAFLEQELASQGRGYVRTFTAGPPPDPLPDGVSSTSVTAWALTAVPRSSPGSRGLCVDSSGAMCAAGFGSAPTLTPEGLCDPEACTPLP